LDDLTALLRGVPPEELQLLVARRCTEGAEAWLRHLSVPSERPPVDEPVRCSFFEEFLAPDELAELVAYTNARERQFRASQVISRDRNEGVSDPRHRRSHVLFDVRGIQELIQDRIGSALPQIFRSLGLRPFAVRSVEAQITASNDGEYFRTHNDNTHAVLRTREITYVLFFHREPTPFAGGELRLYESHRENGRWVAGRRFTSVVPQQNVAVFFPSHLMHEVTTVQCPSRAFADSRFTLNGWLHR
jgi:Rps23 Pro-64 3,4-dihydroxylase Tpa1-like proline 4-hydroxylase